MSDCRFTTTPPQTSSQSIGSTGVSPVAAQAKACGYKKLFLDCNSVSGPAPVSGPVLWGAGPVLRLTGAVFVHELVEPGAIQGRKGAAGPGPVHRSRPGKRGMFARQVTPLHEVLSLRPLIYPHYREKIKSPRATGWWRPARGPRGEAVSNIYRKFSLSGCGMPVTRVQCWRTKRGELLITGSQNHRRKASLP
jgi:hypothetical protein